MRDGDTQADGQVPARPSMEEQAEAREDATLEIPLADLLADGSRRPELPGLTIHRLIGEGGQAKVYAGRQDFLGREVAIKILERGLHKDLADRFQREAKLLAGMQHPFIVGCYDAGTNQRGQCYIVMELIEGPDLFHWIEEHGAMGLGPALGMVRDVASALAHAHAAQIIHRDVKPQNILLQPFESQAGAVFACGFSMRPKLADLGLARANGDANEGMTATGMVMGTPATMALEQFDDPESVDFRADIYGLGCVLFHALVGKGAYEGLRPSKIFMMKSSERAPTVREVVPDVPAGVSELVARMMASDREARPQSYAELIELVEAQLALVGCEVSVPERRGGMRMLGIGGILLLGTGAIWYASQDKPGLADSNSTSALAEREPGAAQASMLGAEPDTSATQTNKAALALTPPADTDAAEALGATAPDGSELPAGSASDAGELEPNTGGAALSRAKPRAKLEPGQRVQLFEGWEDLRSLLVGWRRSSMGNANWIGFDGQLNIPMVTTESTASASHDLPSGSWRLQGEVRVEVPYGFPKSTKKLAGLRIEFEGQQALALELVIAGQEQRAAWRSLDFDGEAWVPAGHEVAWPNEEFLNSAWVAFQVDWQAERLLLSCGDAPPLSIASELLGLGEPSTLSLIVEGGSGIWRRFVLRGL